MKQFTHTIFGRKLAGASLLLAATGLAAAPAFAAPLEPAISTSPIGSPFYRHLAFDFGLDIRDLVKLERRGFGRGEVVTLVLISKSTGTSVRDFARRRLKDKVSLRDLAAEVKLDYPTLLKNVRAIKEGIESKGDQNLPPPVYEPTPTPEPRRRKKKRGEDAASPAPPSPIPSPAAPSPSGGP